VHLSISGHICSIDAKCKYHVLHPFIEDVIASIESIASDNYQGEAELIKEMEELGLSPNLNINEEIYSAYRDIRSRNRTVKTHDHKF
jgi:hypothetical protein